VFSQSVTVALREQKGSDAEPPHAKCSPALNTQIWHERNRVKHVMRRYNVNVI